MYDSNNFSEGNFNLKPIGVTAALPLYNHIEVCLYGCARAGMGKVFFYIIIGADVSDLSVLAELSCVHVYQ